VADRKIEDRLREEYFDLLPEIRRVAQQLEAEIRYYTLPILRTLNPSEQLVVRARVKECESALKTLRRKEGRVFDPEKEYSIGSLPDLAGVRVLAFPNRRLNAIDEELRRNFPDWVFDPIRDDGGMHQASKYFGYCENVSRRIKAEYQVVPMLIGLFWEVEHSAMYKSELVANSEGMKQRRAVVERSLAQFEEGISSLLPDNSPA